MKEINISESDIAAVTTQLKQISSDVSAPTGFERGRTRLLLKLSTASWGRLEAYARLKKADVAVLVAEHFEELMIVTCNLRNEDSKIDWYLIQAQANAHKELSFHHLARPAIDIQTERKAEAEVEFWAPVKLNRLTICQRTPCVREDYPELKCASFLQSRC